MSELHLATLKDPNFWWTIRYGSEVVACALVFFWSAVGGLCTVDTEF